MSFNIIHTPIANPKEAKVTIDNVDKLYLGRGSSCRCGCAGAYYEPQDDQKLIESYLVKMASGDYKVESIDGYIFEIELSRTKNNTKVATLYLKQTKAD